ncbi:MULTISPECIES: hypothetical protein [Enterobacter]|uniref:hypothetical protein n=1 Tax=Enterobacter TaxID=547 RepID=UPI0013D2B30F|nr:MULTISPECIES: hypothetical protein [Enterobacter]NEV85081.1 hypothetical protein [Enterobacter asburiae]NMD68617.1 hypothetical protein [Enterobacter sp. DNRA5]
MYDMAQTNEGEPVMISIYAPGKKSSNMVISYYGVGKCQNVPSSLKVDAFFVPANYSCAQIDNGWIRHFVVSDIYSVNYVVNQLRTGFTVVLQDEIKVWVENFNKPKFGTGPDFFRE